MWLGKLKQVWAFWGNVCERGMPLALLIVRVDLFSAGNTTLTTQAGRRHCICLNTNTMSLCCHTRSLPC
jgi:hypothetical protein